MRYIFLALLFVSLFSACKKEKSEDLADADICWKENITYTAITSKKIDTGYSNGLLTTMVVNGPDLVFIYTLSKTPCSPVIDGIGGERIIFQIPAGTTNFELNDSTKLKNANCYYNSLNSTNIYFTAIKNGSIKGNLLSPNLWTVNVDVTDPLTNRQIKFTKGFIVQ